MLTVHESHEAECNAHFLRGDDERHGIVDKVHLSIALSAITAAQILASFGIQWYTVTQLGAGAKTDALFAGSTLPQVITSLGIESLTFVLIPLLSAKSEDERRRHAWSLFLGIGLLFAILALILFFISPLLIPLIVPGFSQATQQQTISLTQIQLVGLVGAACYAVLAAVCQARNRFVWVALSVLLCTLAGWLTLVWKLPEGGVTLAAWVQVFILTGPALMLLTALGRWQGLKWPHERDLFRETWYRMRPFLMGAAYYRTGFMVDRFLASFLAPGSVVILDLAWRIHAAIVRILNQGIVTPIVPSLARLAQQNNWKDFRAVYRERLAWAFGVSGALVLGLFAVALWGQEIISLMKVGHVAGSLTSEDLTKIWVVLMCSSGVLLCGGVNHTLVNAYYAKGDTSTPTKIEVAAYTLGLLFKLVGFALGGIIGIALAMSLYYIIDGIVLGHCLNTQINSRSQESGNPRSATFLVIRN